MQNITPFSIRLPGPVLEVLRQAADSEGAKGRNGKTSTLAKKYILNGLREDGYKIVLEGGPDEEPKQGQTA